MKRLVLFVAGCQAVFGFDDIPEAPPPHVLATPGPYPFDPGSGAFVFVKKTDVIIGADEPGVTVFYTTDGTDPTTESASGTAPVAVTITAGPTEVRYFGSNAHASDIKSDTYHFDNSQGSKDINGYIVTNTVLADDAAIAVVQPGETIMATANVQVWVQSTCSSCRTQVVYGLDHTIGCLYDASPGVFPGATVSGPVSFPITAPTAPGSYDVRVADPEGSDCDMSIATDQLNVRPDVTRIGTLIVQ